MKKISMFFVCAAMTGLLQAQTWQAPAVPGADLSSLNSTTIVYFYNVNADAFVTNGMTWNTNTCATRLNNGDKKASDQHRCYAFVNGNKVSVRLLDYGDKYISCLSNDANNIYVDQTTNHQFIFTRTSDEGFVYTLKNSAYNKDLDVTWNAGGHLTLIGGAGHTLWTFIPQTSITNGAYALYKAKLALYRVAEAVEQRGLSSKYSDALETAYTAYSASNATETSLKTAARNLFQAVSSDLTEPLDVSFMFDNADMTGSGSCSKWTTSSPAFSWGEFEVFHSPVTLSQEVTVPQGLYDVRFHSLYRQDGNDAVPVLTAVATNTVTAQIPHVGSLDYQVENANNNNWTSGETFIQPNGMQSATQALTHDGAVACAANCIVGTDGKLSVTAKMASSNQWLNWQRMELVYKGTGTQSLKEELSETIAAANELYGAGTENGAAELKAVIDKAQGIYNDSSASAQSIISVIAELKDAMAAYKEASVSLENPLDWSDRIANRSFEKGFESWINQGMQTQSNTAFSKKVGSTYVEKWTGSGGFVGDASVSQELEGLGMGVFILKASAQNIQEGSSNQQSGAWIFANISEEAVHAADEYTLVFTNIENTARIGFKAKDATGNWIACDNFQLYYAGGSLADFKAELQRYVDLALGVKDGKMETAVRTRLESAFNAAQNELAKSTADGYPAVATELRESYEAALVSIQAFQQLQKAINEAVEKYGAGDKLGADKFLAAINQAKAVNENLSSTQQQMEQEIRNLENAAFEYLLDNGSGTAPTVVTDKRYVRGAIAAFGRMKVSGVSSSDLLEQGFCYATHPDPTVLDERTTRYLEQNGRIYVMDMEPATIYYIRAYAMTKNYAVGYGDVIKISTLPMGDVSYTYYNNDGGDFHNNKNTNALSEACWYWSNYTSIRGFHVTANYSSGTPTADCGYGGGMRIGPNTGQRTGTMMHEMNHGIGGGTIPTWGGWNESPLRTTVNGDWAGERANSVLRFWENREDLVITAAYDGAHWGFRENSGSYSDSNNWLNKYAFNGSHLEAGNWAGPQNWNDTQIVYIGNSLINQAMCEDGMIPVNYWSGAFCLPAYVFEQDDQKKYYIKNESENRGLYDAYLTESASGTITWKVFDGDDLVPGDEAAWYVSFDPSTQYYQFRNADTGHYLSYSSAGTNGFKGASHGSPTWQDNFHLIRGRKDVVIGSSSHNMKTRGYWMITPQSKEFPDCLMAQPSGVTSATSLNLYDSGTEQRWVFLDAEEVEALEDYVKANYVSDVKDMIAQVRKLKRVPHTEDVEGADDLLETQLSSFSSMANTVASSKEAKHLKQEVIAASVDFLSSVTPTDMERPFDLTYMIENAAINSNAGWSDTPTFSNSCCEYFQRTFDFNQTLTHLPKGTFKLMAQAFQRPGAYATVYSNYVAGRDNVSAVIYMGGKSEKIQNIAACAQSSGLHSDDVQVSGPSAYIPNTMASAAAYFKKGLYDNSVVAENTQKDATMKIGLRGTVSNDGYWTIFDNFRLYFYGSTAAGEVTGIDEVEMAAHELPEMRGVYNLQGVKVADSPEGLPRGIYIINRRKVMIQ